MPYPSKLDRKAILATAADHVSRDGIQGLAVRSVAASLNVAPNALYRYFANLAALHSALAEESRRRLLAALRKSVGRKAPEDAIRSIARAYLRFARDEPQIFALTLWPSSEHDGNVHMQSWLFVIAHVVPIYGEKQAAKAAVALWAFLHGMTILEASGVFDKQKPVSGFDFGLQIWFEAAPARGTH